jgi:phage N-6-adenine-methyltransferase
MRNMEALMSSSTDMWETPQWLFDQLNAVYHFETDVCAVPENAKCSRFFTPEQDGLKQEWTGVCWMNPPYGREICAWVCKAYESAQNGAIVVCLLPSRTDTSWWHDYCMKGEITFLRGRLKFG